MQQRGEEGQGEDGVCVPARLSNTGQTRLEMQWRWTILIAVVEEMVEGPNGTKQWMMEKTKDQLID